MAFASGKEQGLHLIMESLCEVIGQRLVSKVTGLKEHMCGYEEHKMLPRMNPWIHFMWPQVVARRELFYLATQRDIN